MVSRVSTSTRRRSSRSRMASCAKSAMCGSGGLTALASSESVYALGGQTSKAPTATCPAYTGILIFLAVLYLFFLSCNYTFRPGFMRKAGSSATDANNLEVTSACLYSLLWTGLVLIAIGLVVRCMGCSYK